MTDTSRAPTTAANYNSPAAPGLHAWNISGPGTADLLANTPAGASRDLVFSGFDFASVIPAGVQIDGIALSFVGSSDLPTATDARVVLRVGTGADSANRAKVPTWPGSNTTRAYGGSSDTWGLAAAYPGTTLDEIVRAADFAAVVQVNNPTGDPEDFQRTRVLSPAVHVHWSLPATVREITMVDTASLAAVPRGGSVVRGRIADGAGLDADPALARVGLMTLAGSAAMDGEAIARIARPAVTPVSQTARLADRGSPAIAITDTGSIEGGI